MTIDSYLAYSVTLLGARLSIYRHPPLCVTGWKELEKLWKMKKILVDKDRALLLDGKDVDISDFSPSGFGSWKKQVKKTFHQVEMQERREGDIVREQTRRSKPRSS